MEKSENSTKALGSPEKHLFFSLFDRKSTCDHQLLLFPPPSPAAGKAASNYSRKQI